MVSQPSSRVLVADMIPKHGWVQDGVRTVMGGSMNRTAFERAALVGVAVYLVSTGCLSGAVLLFHPAKPLASALVMTTLYLCGRIHGAQPAVAHAGTPPPRIAGRLWMSVLALMFIAPFVDELAI